jgi:hypothetical protein
MQLVQYAVGSTLISPAKINGELSTKRLSLPGVHSMSSSKTLLPSSPVFVNRLAGVLT